MKWYAAHVIMYTRFKDGNQNKYPIWENIILINANSPNEAYKKVIKKAKEEEGDSSGSYCYEDRPATWVFGGIRKLIDCEDNDERPKNGTEVTYSVFELKDEKKLKLLIEGKPVSIKYIE